MEKPKIGLYWCSSCGGCEESVVDMGEDLLAVAEKVEIVFWPVAMDFKVSDVEALPDGSLAAVLINGAIRLDEQEHMAKLLRKKARLIIAHGACAHMGGVVGLGNFVSRESLQDAAYRDAPTLAGGENARPQASTRVAQGDLSLPSVCRSVRPLDQVVEVDYIIPGCPPTPQLVGAALNAVLSGQLPPRGSVLSDSTALCDSCSRRESKPERIQHPQVKRTHLTELREDRCFLEQGIVCLGPVTRGGCVERCLKGNMPCTGCFGPTDQVMEGGAKFISTLGGVASAQTEEEAEAFARSLPDPAGLLYRYSLACSSIKGRKTRDLP